MLEGKRFPSLASLAARCDRPATSDSRCAASVRIARLFASKPAVNQGQPVFRFLRPALCELKFQQATSNYFHYHESETEPDCNHEFLPRELSILFILLSNFAHVCESTYSAAISICIREQTRQLPSPHPESCILIQACR